MIRYGRGNKYGAKKTVYNGYRYDSKYEAIVARELDLRKAAGEFVEVVTQFKIELYCFKTNGDRVKLFNYICDFRCERPDGTFLLVEAKGVLTPSYKIKKKVLGLIWLPDNPDYEFVEMKRNS